MRSASRACFAFLFTIAAFATISPRAIVAQESTPGALLRTSQTAPAVGAAVKDVNADGVEQGTVTVTEIDDPFTSYPKDRAPGAGNRYVVLFVSFEATGKQSFDANPNNISVRDADGFLWATASVPRGDNPDIPDAQSHKLAPGNKISGAIGFIVPEKAKLNEIYYQPESGHLILLAQLKAETARPVGGAVKYVNADGIEQGDLTVTEIDDPFTGYDKDHAPAAGTRYIVIMVAFEATGKKTFDAQPGDLYVRDANGFVWSTGSVPRGANPDIPDAESQKLAPGNKISGAVGFIVPEKTPIAQIYYQPESGHLILLVDLATS